MHFPPLYVLTRTHHWCKDTAAEAINADKFLIYDFLFIKNSYLRNIITLFTVFFYSFFIPCRAIYVCSTETELFLLKIYQLLFKRDFITIHLVFSDFYSSRHTGIKRNFLDWVSTIVDGAIVPGKMLKKEILLRKKIPVLISYHYPYDDSFTKIRSNINSLNLICIGIKSRDRKGTSKIVALAQKLPSHQFYILGNTRFLPRHLLSEINNIPNLHLPGRVLPHEYIKKCTFFILPGEYDAGPIALTEAISAGLIPIISDKLGGQDLVKLIASDLIIPGNNIQKYQDKIVELSLVSSSHRSKLSHKARKIGKFWQRKNGMKDFKVKFNQLLNIVFSQHQH